MLTNVIEFLKAQEVFGLYQTLYSPEGVILYSSNKALSLLYAVTLDDLCGKTLFDLSALGYLSDDKARSLDAARKTVITTKQLARYINIVACTKCNYTGSQVCYCNPFQAIVLEANHYPLVDESGEVFATLEQSSRYNKFSVSDFSKLSDGVICRDSDANQVAQINFTQRELEILYLLINKISQRDVAAFFGVSRGTISKAITAQISRKLGLESNDQESIIKKATDMGIDHMIPRTLVKQGLVLLASR
jgi:DNA-binding CsgD family transcriptional regulator